MAEQGIFEPLYGAWDKWLGGKTWPPTTIKVDTKRRCEKRLISLYVYVLKICFLKTLRSTQVCRCNTSLELQKTLHILEITVGTHTYVALPKIPQLPFAAFQKLRRLYRLYWKSAILTCLLSRSRKDLASTAGHQLNAKPEELFRTARWARRWYSALTAAIRFREDLPTYSQNHCICPWV